MTMATAFALRACVFGGKSGLRQCFEHHDGLIRARHDGFGNGDKFILLAEYPQPWRLRLPAIELRRRSWRWLDAARLKLREHNVEFRAMAYALFDHRQDVDPRKITQQAFKRDQAVRESSGLLGFGELLERDRLFQRKLSHRRARNLRQVRAAPQLLPHLIRQRTDVRAGGALDDKARDAALNLLEFVLVNLDFDGLQLHSLFLARQLIRRSPFYFLRGK